MEIDVDIKDTGEKKAINGFDTHQVIMTITLREKGKTLEQGGGMVTTTDMWLAPKIAAMKEIADFDVRYAQQLYGGMFAGASAEQMAAAMAIYPMMKQAMGRMTHRRRQARRHRDHDDGDDGGGEVRGADGRSRRQPADEQKPCGRARRPARRVREEGGGQEGDDESKARATFMTSTNEVLKVATDVSAADVAMPAGLKRTNRD